MTVIMPEWDAISILLRFGPRRVRVSRRVGKDKRANTNGKMDEIARSDFCDFVVVQLVKFRKKFFKFRLWPKTKEILTPRNRRRMRIPREKGASFSLSWALFRNSITRFIV